MALLVPALACLPAARPKPAVEKTKAEISAIELGLRVRELGRMMVQDIEAPAATAS